MAAGKADGTVQIKLIGRADKPRLPTLLLPTARSGSAREDPFLPPTYLQPRLTLDVGTAARSAGEGTAEQQHGLGADEVLVLELADGSSLITSAQRLRASLEQTHPALLGAGGTILLEKLRAQGAAPGRGLGEAVGGLISKVFSLAVGQQPDAIIGDALAQVGGKAELGLTWAGTKALMWAIEKRLEHEPGLYHWAAGSGGAADFEAPKFSAAALAEPALYPMLVFVHGTASSTLGSFGDLRTGDRDLWTALERQFSGGIFAFEHRTLSESPIDNALQLVKALPPGANICLVSHSRGGLVADLLCLGDFDALIEGYTFPFDGTGDADPAEAQRVLAELAIAHAEHRAKLRELAALLREKKPVVRRYVRAASPANGTKLASGNFDVFLSGLLTLIGQVPFFFGSPLYSAFKRVVIEIARNRTNPHLVPGIEAMLPDSPMAQLLRDAPVRAGTQMAVIAGDIQGGHLLRRLGVMLTDFLLFDSEDNDLVVNTSAMLAGIAPRVGSKVLFDRGSDVSHFRYFTNTDTRAALRDWLVAADPLALGAFRALPAPGEFAQALAESASRDALSAKLPVVVVLPGVMGSHLAVSAKDRVWFDPLDIAAGGLGKIAWGQAGVEASELFAMFYGHLCKHLAGSHRVETFPYDWRQPLDVLAERLGQFLDRLMKETDKPIRLLAHSMGGLVVRATIHKRRAVMDALMQREGARIVMLGTPNQGAHSMVENLIGKGDTLRTLVRLDVEHDMQQVLDIVAGFRGALSLLPKPGFKDIFQGQPEGGGIYAFQQAETWAGFVAKVGDFWFGDGRVGRPDQATLDAAAWLWRQDDAANADQNDAGRPRLPAAYEAKSCYVFGVARNTPCGVREQDGRLKMVGTTRGDGTVTWESGRIGGIGSFYYMPAEHGDLPATKEYFPAIAELLASGATAKLSVTPPALRAIEQPEPVGYDAGPPVADDPDALERGLMGGSLRNRVPPRPRRRLEVSVKAMDLRFLSEPILVGTYEQDPIAGPQGLIDRELLAGDLSERHTLGLYAGPRGTATVVLRVPSEIERQRGTLSGAIVTGLGQYEGALSLADLTEAVRTGALRYLLQVIDVLGKAEREVSLASLLLGYNSSANLSVDASVEALVRGVMEANAKFYETTRLNIRIARLSIVELYLDTAISAAYALRHLTPRLTAQAAKQGTLLICRGELDQGEGVRQRLFDSRSSSYWPRLIVTDADRSEEQCAPDCTLPGTAGEASAPTLIADRLRFLYVGQRARAESVVQQRQPGLIEKLVRQQIHDKTWNPDFGRMLFQLMVPHDFKDSARQFDRVVLVVDAATANLPWELMLADDPSRADDDKRPLALRTALVRQLSSLRFRRHVRQSMERTALVIGNPSVQGFAAAFAGVPGVAADPPNLAGAQAEAEAVVSVLGSMGYEVERVIGSQCGASEVLAALYRRPWRILHISAHGIFNLRHGDGRMRSGVVLSDGLLITAAEIAAMELVPELVFLNCCHLGQVDMGRDGNKLAASVARELIDVGVRCVVVAGWAVDDELARLFGQTLYAQLLLRRRSFGDAVFHARQATWEANRDDITWGAFQAYGDPGWLAEPRADGGDAGGQGGQYVSPEEVLDELARVRADLSRQRERLSEREVRARADAVEACLTQRCPPGWRSLPQLQSALGATWRDLGQWEKARDAYVAAIQADDRIGQVPIRDIEQLAKVEAFLGEQRAEAELNTDQTPAAGERGMDLLNLALRRLRGLDALVSARAAEASEAEVIATIARAALRGGVYKRKASVAARQLLRGGLAANEQDEARDAMTRALNDGVSAYASAEGHPGAGRFSPYLALNRLALDALTDWPSPGDRDASIALAQQCQQRAVQGFARNPNLWDAVMQADALLVERLLDGSLGLPGEAGHTRFDELARAYDTVLSNISVKASQVDAMVAQMELLSRLCDALSLTQFGNETLALMAERLMALLQRLQPGHAPRDDRPARAPAVEAAVAAATPRKRARKPVAKAPKKMTAATKRSRSR
nr:CHAT domain-containing protein [uncultured Roseateles sp.]